MWDQKGVPHKGWTCIDMIDLGTALDRLDADSRRDYYAQCQTCKHESIRYVHLMPPFSLKVTVGQQCAEKMEDDYMSPKPRETRLKNKQKRGISWI